MSKGTGLILNILLLFLGVIFVYSGIDAIRSNSSNWPAANAKISGVELSTTTDSLGVKLEAATYDYAVNNKSYSHTINTDKGTYHVGDKLTVYYDPSDPGESELTHGEMGFFGFFEIALGILAIVYAGWKIFKKMRQ